MVTITDPVDSYEDITPELAAKWLEDFNHHNRPVSEHRLRPMIDDMLNGRWMRNGEAGITFDWNGDIAGGQHTLTAVVRSGVTIRCRITRGVDPSARATMNDAYKQRFAHDLALAGVRRNTVMDEALLRKVIFWNGIGAANKGVGGLAGFRSGARLSRATLTAEWPKYAAEIIDTMDKVAGYNSTEVWPGNRGAMVFMYWLLAHRTGCNPVAVTEYFDRVVYGTNDEEDRILFSKLRKKLDSNPDASVQVYWLLRTWNAWVKGEKLTKLQAPKGSSDQVTGKMVLPDPYPAARRTR
jgi:hypothetical protein